MNITDRLNRIAKAKERRDYELNEILSTEERAKEAYISFLKENYGEKARELIIVANGLIKNGFPLGYDDCYTSDGIVHNFGFVVYGCSKFNNISIRGIGFEGGGVCGDDFYITEDGAINFSEYFYKRVSGKDWMDAFDEFENKFYKYVDSL